MLFYYKTIEESKSLPFEQIIHSTIFENIFEERNNRKKRSGMELGKNQR